LRGDVSAASEALAIRIHGAMITLEQRLKRDFEASAEHIARVVSEQLGSQVRVLDDKYSHLPAESVELRRDLDDHRTNPRIHVRPQPKQARKSRR
jgi:hypothetical protein